MSNGQSAFMLRGWGVKAGMAHFTCELNVRVAGKNCLIPH